METSIAPLQDTRHYSEAVPTQLRPKQKEFLMHVLIRLLKDPSKSKMICVKLSTQYLTYTVKRRHD